jgi:hypothetical protein
MAEADDASTQARNDFLILAITVCQWTHLMGPFVYDLARESGWRRQYIDNWYKGEIEALESNRSRCEAILKYPDELPASTSKAEQSNLP